MSTTQPIKFTDLGLAFDAATRTYHSTGAATRVPNRVVEAPRAAPRCRVATIQLPAAR